MIKEVPTLEKLVKQASYLRKVYAKMSYPQVKDYHFSPCELDILILLTNNPTIHTAKELVTYLGVTKSLVARSVESLLQRSLLKVEASPQDRRIQYLYVTENTSSITTVMRKNQAEFSKEILRNITVDDLLTTQKVMEQINDNIEELLKGVKKE